MRVSRSAWLISLLSTAAAAQPAFTAVPQSDAGVGGTKQGGTIAVDLTGDGCAELVVNTHADSRLLHGDCSGGFPVFTDVTDSLAAGFTRFVTERSVISADVDNDGDRDVLRDTDSRLEVYLNGGPPAFALGDAVMDPSAVISGSELGAAVNFEGLAALDFDADGWLDLGIQNSGVDLLRNSADGSGGFTLATPATGRRGLPTGLVNGDYGTAADVDADGDVDLLVRNVGALQLWLNDGAGMFTGAESLTPSAIDVDLKSGVAVCDFDRDGDLDVYWGGVSSALPDELWLQQPDRTFARSAAPNGTGASRDIACGDLDHDGDVDAVLSHSAGVRLLLNEGTGTFTPIDPPSLAGGESWAVVLADLDADGDLDLYANQDGANGLWRNDLDDGRSLAVSLRTRLPGRAERDALGASVVMLGCDGQTVLGGRRDLSGGRGRGSQDSPVLHFGLPPGPPAPVILEARFVGGVTRRRAVNPAALTRGAVITIRESDPDAYFACALPRVIRNDGSPSAHQRGASSLLADGRWLLFGGAPDSQRTDFFEPFSGAWTTTSATTVDGHASIGAATLPNGNVITLDFGVEPCLLFSPDAGGAWRTCPAQSALRDRYQLVVHPDGDTLHFGGSGPAGTSAATDLFDELLEQWSAGAPLQQPRTEFASALLADGTVLAVGGGPTVYTERWTAAGGWADAGALPDPAPTPCLVRLWDGRVLAGDPGRSALYDPPSDTWAQLTGTGAFSVCGGAALLPDGRVAARAGATPAVWLFDPLSLTWEEGPPLDGITDEVMSAVLPTGRWAVYSLGVLNVIDPGGERWGPAPAPPAKAPGASLTLLADGEVLLAGGGSAEAYRFSTGNGWRATSSMRQPHTGHRATLLLDGRVLITGGEAAPELYEPRSETWTVLPDTAIAGDGHSVTPLLDGRALLVSGASATAFEPATLQFEGSFTLSASHSGHTATRLFDGRVLIAGGGTAATEVFTPGTDTFAPSGDLGAARTGAAAVLLPSGEVLVTGDSSAERWTNGTWAAAGAFSVQRSRHSAVPLRNGKVLLLGGTPGGAPELFDPFEGVGRVLPVASTDDARATRLADGRLLFVSDGAASYLDEGRGGVATHPALEAVAVDGGTLTVLGGGWMSAPQGADGMTRSTAANLPVLFLERPETLELRASPLASWTNDGGVAAITPELGATGVYVVVTGVPSSSQAFFNGIVDAGCSAAAQCATRRCEDSRCCFTCADGTCRTDGCPEPDAGVDAGPDAGPDAREDAGEDAGVDAGPEDAGPDAAVADAGPPRILRVGCGCQEGAPGSILLALLAAAGMLRSRSRRRR